MSKRVCAPLDLSKENLPETAATLQEASGTADVVNNADKLCKHLIPWLPKKWVITLSYLRDEVAKKYPAWQDLLVAYSSMLPVDLTVTSIVFKPDAGTIEFAAQSCKEMRSPKEHLQSSAVCLKRFLRKMDMDTAYQNLLAGVRVISLIQFITSKCPPGTPWDNIEFNGEESLALYFYGAQIRIAMALSALMLHEDHKEASSFDQLLVLSNRSLGKRETHDPPTSSKRSTFAPMDVRGFGQQADVRRTRVVPRDVRSRN